MSARRWRDAGLLVGPVLRLLAIMWALVLSGPAHALKPIPVTADADRIEVTSAGQIFEGRGDSFQLETAAGTDGVPDRMGVRAQSPGTSPTWLAFALTNATDRPMERWLIAERYSLIGSGIIWPDLDSRRIELITPSVGFLPERLRSDRADIFRITLEPGQTVTYVAEQVSNRPTRIFVWKPLEYEIKARDQQLFNGIMLGITGVLGIFLTAIFAANHKAIFPSAALVAWCVLGYLCADFGFFHKLFNLRADDNAVYRAATEGAVAASLVIFLSTFLRLSSWHGFIRMLIGVWIIAQLALVGLAVVDPRLAATFARASFVVIGALGAVLILFLAVRGQDRALSLVPTWILFLVFVFAAGVAMTGRLQGEAVLSGLVAGLVLLVVLIGFTVTQFAFTSFEASHALEGGGGQLGSMAIDGAGVCIWEWQTRRNEIKTGSVIEAILGRSLGELSTKVDEFIRHIHPADQEKFRLLLWSVKEKGSGTITMDVRMRHADNSYRWFSLDAASVQGGDARSLRCVGLMRDITEQKRAHERLMQDAVNDSLTGLPNRELFIDRLGIALARAKAGTGVQPTVLFLDLDKFKSVNSSFGLVVGDSLLLTVARRISKHLKSDDTLARVAGDQFAILLLSEQDPHEIAQLAERARRSIRAPIKIIGQEIVLTGSLGIAVVDGPRDDPYELLKDAEIAMHRAKRDGADRIEIFRPEMRAEVDNRVPLESELRQALEKKQLKVFYQPIVYLPTEELSGFEALVRWDHPKLGRLGPAEFIPVAEASDLIVELGDYVLQRAVENAAQWQKELPRPDRPLFVAVNVSSRQLFRADLIQTVRQALTRNLLPKGALKLEITESLVMENPEQATEILAWLKSAGAELALDDFGTGYSSLAYLQRFPFDTIKIDRALVEGSGASADNAVIVRSIVSLAHELGRKVVAEGIENEEDATFLRSINCEYAQGYFYGEPLPDRDVLNMLRMIRKTERKLQRRGFFRAKPPAQPEASARKPRNKVKPGGSGAGAYATTMPGATAAPAAPIETPIEAPVAAPVGASNGVQPPTHLPASTIRPRPRPIHRPSPSSLDQQAPQFPPDAPQSYARPEDAAPQTGGGPIAASLPAAHRPYPAQHNGNGHYQTLHHGMEAAAPAATPPDGAIASLAPVSPSPTPGVEPPPAHARPPPLPVVPGGSDNGHGYQPLSPVDILNRLGPVPSDIQDHPGLAGPNGPMPHRNAEHPGNGVVTTGHSAPAAMPQTTRPTLPPLQAIVPPPVILGAAHRPANLPPAIARGLARLAAVPGTKSNEGDDR